MRREAGRRLLQVAQRPHAAGVKPMGEEEIVPEAEAARSGRRVRPTRHRGRTRRSREAAPRCERRRLGGQRRGPTKLIEAAAAGDIELVTSPALLAELRDVLGREHLASRLVQQRSPVDEAIALYAELAIGVSPLATPRVVPVAI